MTPTPVTPLVRKLAAWHASVTILLLGAAFSLVPACHVTGSNSRQTPTATPTAWMSPILVLATVTYTGSVSGSHPLVLEFRKPTGPGGERVWRTVASIGEFPASIAIDRTSLPASSTVRAWWAVAGSTTVPLAGDPVSPTTYVSFSGTTPLMLQ